LTTDLGIIRNAEYATVTSVCERGFKFLLSTFGQGQADFCTGSGYYTFQMPMAIFYVFSTFSVSFIGNCSDTFVVMTTFAVYIVGKDFSQVFPTRTGRSAKDLEKVK